VNQSHLHKCQVLKKVEARIHLTKEDLGYFRLTCITPGNVTVVPLIGLRKRRNVYSSAHHVILRSSTDDWVTLSSITVNLKYHTFPGGLRKSGVLPRVAYRRPIPLPPGITTNFYIHNNMSQFQKQLTAWTYVKFLQDFRTRGLLWSWRSSKYCTAEKRKCFKKRKGVCTSRFTLGE